MFNKHLTVLPKQQRNFCSFVPSTLHPLRPCNKFADVKIIINVHVELEQIVHV